MRELISKIFEIKFSSTTQYLHLFKKLKKREKNVATIEIGMNSIPLYVVQPPSYICPF